MKMVIKESDQILNDFVFLNAKDRALRRINGYEEQKMEINAGSSMSFRKNTGEFSCLVTRAPKFNMNISKTHTEERPS